MQRLLDKGVSLDDLLLNVKSFARIVIDNSRLSLNTK